MFNIHLTLFCIFVSMQSINTKQLECPKMTHFCRQQCNVGGEFQKSVCIVECDKNGVVCNYLTGCVIPDNANEKTLSSFQEPPTTSEDCFRDYAKEYFCRHIYHPCMISCLKDSKQLCNICERRKTFCECGIKAFTNIDDSYTASTVRYNIRVFEQELTVLYGGTVKSDGLTSNSNSKSNLNPTPTPNPSSNQKPTPNPSSNLNPSSNVNQSSNVNPISNSAPKGENGNVTISETTMEPIRVSSSRYLK